MPVEASPRSSVANVSVSDADSPEEGSSSSSTRGWVASARATSTSRAVPVGSSSALVDATACRPRCSMIVSVMTSGLPAPVRAHRRRCSSRRHPDVVPHGERPEHLEPLEGAGEAEPGELVRPRAGHVLAVDEDPALVGLLHAGGDVEQRRLARAVRPDEADDLPVLQVEADLVDRRAGRRSGR